MVCHFLLQGIFLIQVSNTHLLCLLHWQAISLPLSYLGSHSWLMICAYYLFPLPVDSRLARPLLPHLVTSGSATRQRSCYLLFLKFTVKQNTNAKKKKKSHRTMYSLMNNINSPVTTIQDRNGTLPVTQSQSQMPSFPPKVTIVLAFIVMTSLYLLLLSFLAMPCSLWDLGSLTSGWTGAPWLPALEAQNLNHWITKEVPWGSVHF